MKASRTPIPGQTGEEVQLEHSCLTHTAAAFNCFAAGFVKFGGNSTEPPRKEEKGKDSWGEHQRGEFRRAAWVSVQHSH